MIATPTPNARPFDDELAEVDRQISNLQRAAGQAEASSAAAASEVAITQRAIRDLTIAKAEIIEKGRLWDRDAQLQRALAERRPVAEQVRLAIGAGGSLDKSRKTALEDRLKPKFKIAAGTPLSSLNAAVVTAENALGDADLKSDFEAAELALANAEKDYQTKAAAAEDAWLAVQNGSRILEENLQKAQMQLAEAVRLEAAAAAPTPASGSTPAGPVVDSAAEAGIAWKAFKDTFSLLEDGTKMPSPPTGQPDDGETALAGAWNTASTQAMNALAVLLTRRQELAVARIAYEQRQAVRPARTPQEQAAMVASVLRAFNPPPGP